MAKKKTAESSADPPPEAAPPEPVATESPCNGESGSPAARTSVRKFSCPCGKDEHLHVEVVESEYPGPAGRITILSAVCSRTYARPDGGAGMSYSYRAQHIPLLAHLLSLAHGFIVSQRVVEDVPF